MYKLYVYTNLTLKHFDEIQEATKKKKKKSWMLWAKKNFIWVCF